MSATSTWSDTAIEDIRNSRLTQYFGVASLTILLYDHMITFSDKVELIWKGVKGPLVYLFFLNRYIIPLSFLVNIYAYFSHSWTLDSHFVRFEGAMTQLGLCVVQLMMFFRIRALYREVWAVQAFVIAIFLAYVGVNSWLLTRGIPVQHEAYPYVDSCTMIIDPRVSGPIAASSAWLPLLFGTVAMGLTLYRTAIALYTKSHGAGQILRVMLQDGLLYYSVILAVTLTLTVMIVSANQSVRNITAQLELCLTVTMMGRITLHLKRFAHTSTTIDSSSDTVARWHVTRRRRRPTNARRTHEVSTLRAALPGWSTVLDSESGGAATESFALESRTQQPCVSAVCHDTDDGEAPPLGTLTEVGDEEMAGV